MKKIVKIFIRSVLIFFIFLNLNCRDKGSIIEHEGNAYYVAITGSNSNPGSQEKPWASPGFASRRLEPGDTLIISAGSYILSEYDGDIIMPRSGSENAYISNS